MPIYNFLPRFAPKVESGEKRQTIRRKRMRPTKAGDRLFLYTGLRTKERRLLAEEECQSVRPITIMEGGIQLDGGGLWYADAADLALADGFDSLEELIGFFREHYGLPFQGELIEW